MRGTICRVASMRRVNNNITTDAKAAGTLTPTVVQAGVTSPTAHREAETAKAHRG